MSSVRQRRAVRLRAAGVSFREIADQLGYASRQSAWAAVQSAPRDELGVLSDHTQVGWTAMRLGLARAGVDPVTRSAVLEHAATALRELA